MSRSRAVSARTPMRPASVDRRSLTASGDLEHVGCVDRDGGREGFDDAERVTARRCVHDCGMGDGAPVARCGGEGDGGGVGHDAVARRAERDRGAGVGAAGNFRAGACLGISDGGEEGEVNSSRRSHRRVAKDVVGNRVFRVVGEVGHGREWVELSVAKSGVGLVDVGLDDEHGAHGRDAALRIGQLKVEGVEFTRREQRAFGSRDGAGKRGSGNRNRIGSAERRGLRDARRGIAELVLEGENAFPADERRDGIAVQIDDLVEGEWDRVASYGAIFWKNTHRLKSGRV
jgi:hypothetical protein